MSVTTRASGYTTSTNSNVATSPGNNFTAGAVVVVCVHCDQQAGFNPTFTITDNGGGTRVGAWTPIGERDDSDGLTGGVAAFWAEILETVTDFTLTFTVTITNQGTDTGEPAIRWYEFLGDVDLVDPIGEYIEGDLTTDPFTTPEITPQSSGWGVAAWTDWNQTGAGSSSDLTVTGFDITNDISGGSGRKTITAGVAVTANIDSPATPAGNYLWFEVKDTASMAGPEPTVQSRRLAVTQRMG